MPFYFLAQEQCNDQNSELVCKNNRNCALPQPGNVMTITVISGVEYINLSSLTKNMDTQSCNSLSTR